jgi:hypothetical protein
MGCTACTEPQCLYKGALYFYLTVELYIYSPYEPYGLYRASVPVQECTLPLPYSRAISLFPLWAVRPVQSLSAYTRVHFTFTYYSTLNSTENCEKLTVSPVLQLSPHFYATFNYRVCKQPAKACHFELDGPTPHSPRSVSLKYALLLPFHLHLDLPRIFSDQTFYEFLNFSTRGRQTVHLIHLCVISSFRREADDNCALQGYYAACSCNSLPTFRDKISVPIIMGQE